MSCQTDHSLVDTVDLAMIDPILYNIMLGNESFENQYNKNVKLHVSTY